MTRARPRGTRWALLGLLSTAIVGFVVLTVLLISLVVQERAASAAFEEAVAAQEAAVAERAGAASALGAARTQALAAAADAEAVLAEVPPGLLDDASLLEPVRTGIDALAEAAGLQVIEGGGMQASPPETFAAESIPERPRSRSARHAAAAEITLKADAIAATARRLTTEHDRVEAALGDLDEVLRGAVASASAAGGATALLPHTPESAQAPYLAAHAALQNPDATTGPATLLRDYAGAWAAVAAAQDAVLQGYAIASRTGVGCELIEPTYIQGVLVANKSYPLPCTFGNGLTTETQSAYAAMAAEASRNGHSLSILSGWRSYQSQRNGYESTASWQGRDATDRHIARPGHSEHQAGLAIDLNCSCSAFAQQPAGIWVAQNAHHFGFIVRYPEGREHITGYMYEPWHLRYLGVDVASAVYESGLTLEEYFGIDSRYRE